MRTDQLGDALHRQADTVHDIGAADRLHAVKGRVRVARRRRTAAVGAVAVAAVALVGVAVLPGAGDRGTGPADAPAVLAGHDVPETIEAAGFTYTYVEGVAGEAGENPLELDVDMGDEPRLVSFASSESGSTLLAESSQGGHMGGPSGDFSTHLLLQPGTDRETVTLRQLDGLGDGALALAVYELADEPPAGVTDGKRTFRERVADWTLVDGRIGEPGQNEVTFSVTLPEGRLRWDSMCSAGGDGLMVKYSVEGAPGYVGSGCGPDDRVGPDASQGSSEAVGTDPAPRGRPVEVRVWLGPTDAAPDQVADDPDVVLGLAVYRHDGTKVNVLGERLDATFEAAGHTWEVGTVQAVSGADGSYTLPLSASPTARMVQIVVRHATDRSVELRHGVSGIHDDTIRAISPGVGTGTTVLGPLMVLPGEERTVSLRFRKGWTPDAEVAVVTSPPAG